MKAHKNRVSTRDRAAWTLGAYRLIAILVSVATLAAPVSNAAAQPRVPATSLDRSAMFAQTLIEAELRTGGIDYPTSLVYRAYALNGDPRLPENLAGSGSLGEDSSLFREIPRNWDRLPKQTRDLLTPFIVRPTDPHSRFFRSAGDTGQSVSHAQADGACDNGWVSRAGPTYHYRLWMQCTGDHNADFDAVIDIIDGFWEREVELMGDPLPDGGSALQGGDSRIDFYFVEDESVTTPRHGQRISEGAAASAIADEPVVGKGSSAFVVARRPYIGDPGLSLTLAHEFFHVLEYARNWEIGFGFKGTPYSSDFDILSLVLVWFVEASADWMKSYIYRDTFPPEVMQTYLHYRFTQYLQGVDLPLTFSTTQDDPGVMRSYGAYVYFLFLEQERGAKAIGDFWRALEDVEADDFDRMTAILDELLPFKEYFREYAVRNFNLDLEPGDPISPSYQDIDPSFPVRGPELNFAKGQNGRLPLQESGESPQEYDDRLYNLTAHYYYFTPDADATQVTFDFSGLVPNEAIDVDALVKIKDGEWERRQLATDRPVTFCRDVPEDDVEKLYIVVSNHDLRDIATVRGTFTAGAFDGACR